MSLSNEHVTQNQPAQEISDLTELVRSAWKNTLEHDAFEDNTSFFDAGGDSFVMLSLVTELKKLSGLTVKAVHILRAPTIQGQAAVLSELAASPDS
jgi:aryl carrier-like protein